MKKQLMFVALFASAVSLVGCEEPNKPVDPTPGGDVKIVVNPHEVVLTEEEPTIRLSATLNPADASATIVWSSSDDQIATVTNRGVVEAVDFGECYIYASVGDAKDSCHVIVKSYLESLIFNGAVMASDAFFPFGDCVEIAHKEGVDAVIQPGGSVRDQESIDYCNNNGVAMVMTGIRHFRH